MPETLPTIKVILLRVWKKKSHLMFIKRRTEELGVKGVVGGRSKITKEGRVTWAELFPFPEVTAKYGHGARNRYFPALCRDCAISHLGWGALETYCISSRRESYFHPGQIAARAWGPNRPSCTVAPNMRLTTSPSGITASFPGCMAAQKKRRAQRKVSGGGWWAEESLNIYWCFSVKRMYIKNGG